ncbi:MAG: hypothetical protein K8I27_00585 [Planctomycetes bacterium]|nr:hypothetical protein [Planctomycetota bacterium]
MTSVLNSQNEPAEEYRPPRKFTFGLFGVAMREDLTVYQGGARDADGNIVIKEKDQLLKWNGTELKTLDDFCRSLYATKPGDIVEVEIATPGDGEKRLVHTAKVKLGDPRENYKELYTHLDKRKRTYDWRDNEAVTKGGPLREKLWPHIQKHKLERPWDNLIAAHERELDLWDSYENLSSTDLLLSDPLSAHQWLRDVGNVFAGSIGVDIASPTIRLLDGKESDWNEPELPDLNEDDPESWRDRADAIIELIQVLDMSAAWDRVSRDVAAFEFHWRGDPEFSSSTSVVDTMRNLNIGAAKRLVYLKTVLDELRTMAETFWELHEGGKGIKSIYTQQEMADFVDGKAICFASSYGPIAVGGTGKNTWRGGVIESGHKSPRIIIDLGGDDEYVDCASTGKFQMFGIVLDLTGNDHYRSTGKWGVACGILGTAIIDDHEGDDTYECGDWGIGAAFGGIGLLIDRKGNDRYLGGSNSIGCAAYGVGGVIDLEGNDLYDSHVYSVGCGQPGGVGFVLDHSGDDRYRCTGKEPSPYGTVGEWFGGGIGCGFGWRTLACGGIGLVVDVTGNDIYDAGEFGLACGYFMGVGAVRDMDGDDIYHSSRYGLAAAAHAAVGVFMDDKGDDVYEGKTAASIGGTWDIVTGYFYDGAGDDVYRCDGLGLGACAQNGFGIFWDAGGSDYYRGGGGTLGHAGKAEYAGGRLAKNFGIFIDSGGGEDTYPRKQKNGAEVLTGEYGLFLDE